MDKKIQFKNKEYDIEKMTIEERKKLKEEIKENRIKREQELKNILKIGDV